MRKGGIASHPLPNPRPLVRIPPTFHPSFARWAAIGPKKAIDRRRRAVPMAAQ